MSLQIHGGVLIRPAILLLLLAARLAFGATVTLTGPGASGDITGFGSDDIAVDAEINQPGILPAGTESSAVVSATGVTFGPSRPGVLEVFSESGESESAASMASEQIGSLSCVA